MRMVMGQRDIMSQTEQYSDFPTTMSCTEAFDQLAQCYSVGGQIRNYYRYGAMNDCVNELDKLKFCLFNNDPVKIQQYHKKVLEEKKGMGSSEDIWELRA